MNAPAADLVSYEHDGAIATITMDDGRVNVVSLAMVSAVNDALDRALADDAVVVLQGREGVFSAGFDLTASARRCVRKVDDGAGRLRARRANALVPRPIVIGVHGPRHRDGRLPALLGRPSGRRAGPFKLVANEVAIGLTMPHAAWRCCAAASGAGGVRREP